MKYNKTNRFKEFESLTIDWSKNDLVGFLDWLWRNNYTPSAKNVLSFKQTFMEN